MSEDNGKAQTGNTPGGKPSRVRRWRILLLVLAVIAAWWGYKWLTRPHPITLRKEYQSFAVPQFGKSGFLIQPRPDEFAFCAWDGRKQWKVTTPTADWTGWNNDDFIPDTVHNMGTVAALSPDEQLLATATLQGYTLHVICWRGGSKQWAITLPVASRVPHNPFPGNERLLAKLYFTRQNQVLMKSHLYAGLRNPSQTELFLLNGGKVIATATHPTAVAIAKEAPVILETSGGVQAYYTWSVKNRKIVLQKRWEHETSNLWLLPNGRVMTYEGDVYDHTGQIYQEPENWYRCRADYRYPDEWIVQQNDDTVAYRLFSPATLRSFPVRSPIVRNSDLFPYAVSSNGKYILLVNDLSPKPPLSLLTDRVPMLERTSFQWLYTINNREGKILASTMSTGGTLLDEEINLSSDYAVSPDGHYILQYRKRDSHKHMRVHIAVLGWE